jgi:WD40 repeat protein
MQTNLTKLIFYFILTLSPLTWASEPSGTPILRIETEMHTDRITQISVDAKERFLLTASEDKTLRLWDLNDEKQKPIVYRVPIGTGFEGVLNAGAISPDDKLVAGGGWTGFSWENGGSIYLFNHQTGNLIKRLYGLPDAILHLCFSPDGQYLAASLLGGFGIRVWETHRWEQVFSDTQYGNDSSSCQFDSKNRLLTTSYDGYLRLYSLTGDNFVLTTKTQPPGGTRPFRAVFSPSGTKIAVGFENTTQINVLDSQTLVLLYAPDTSGVNNGNLATGIAWSPDEQRLCAGGTYLEQPGNTPIRCWSQGGQGISTDWLASSNTIAQIRFLKNGDLVYGATDPSWGILDSAGQKKQEHVAPIADYRTRSINKLPEQDTDILWVSYDGSVVQFGFEQGGSRPARFSLNQQLLLLYPSPDPSLQLPDTISLNITDWRHNLKPKLKGMVLPSFLESEKSNETSRALAIAPDKSTFLLGTEYALRLYDATSQLLLRTILIPSAAWAVNISGDGQKAIAALADGTIRWYNLATGEELLAFFPHTDGKRWIAWTPSGYYMSAGENADKLLGWHFNQKSKDQEAKFYPINALQIAYQEMSDVANKQPNPEINKKRPDIVKQVLKTLTEDKAILVANLEQGIDAGQKMSSDNQSKSMGKKLDVNSTPSGLGKAIIVAASGPKSGDNINALFTYTNEFTEKMYNLLYNRGFSDDDVIYINPYPPAVPSGNLEEIQRRDYPLTEPLTELEAAFNLAAGLKSGQQFIFYLHGHAVYQRIQLRLGQGGQPSVDLLAQKLKEWLTRIPKGVTQIIILDTCHSGSFLAELAGVPDRIVVTSTDSDSSAWTPDKGESFADTFMRELSNSSIAEAFKSARKTVLCGRLFGNQSPQLDDNQDGQYVGGKDVPLCNKSLDDKGQSVEVKDGQLACRKLDDNQDGQLACKTYIGGNKLSASVPPDITVHPAIYLNSQETTATLWVKTSVDMNTVNKVQAILTNENDKPTEYQGEQTQFTHREITLTPNYELQRFEADYNGFQAAKQWRIFYQVETIEGQQSDFAVGLVRTGGDTSSVTIKAIMTQPTYQLGDPFSFEVMVAGEGNFDLYVGFIFPGDSRYTIASPFVFSEKNQLLPYQKNLQLAGPQTFTILSLGPGLLPALVPGEYQACGLLTKAQSDPENRTNWVKLDCQVFRF